MNHLKKKVACGLLLIVIGFSFLISDFIVQEREETFSRVNIEINNLLASQDATSNTSQNDNTSTEQPQQEENTAPEQTNTNTNTEEVQYERFAGVLEIPKINFSKGFYKKGSSLNNVKFNLKILDVSTYPDEIRGNVIIIGHSGNYSNSYFGNLYQLTINDTASITYQGRKYYYKVVNNYNEDKDGTVTIYRDQTKNCLTLITCTKDDEKNKQYIYLNNIV